MATRDAIKRDGLEIDPASLAFCAYEWINSAGHVHLEARVQIPAYARALSVTMDKLLWKRRFGAC
jgi:hypothetical protein